METSTASLPNMEDLDKLSDRLGKFKSSSRLPKPEISPKPAHLVAQLAKHKVPNAQTEQQVSDPSKKSPTTATNGTSNMLKSTLKRMTKITTSPINRSSSFKEPQMPQNSTRSLNRSNSLKRVKNKDQNSQNYPLSRSGTGGTLDRNLRRTPSMTTVRKFRDKDLNVKLSRGVQTQLTKDTVDEPDFDEGGNIPKNVEFTIYLPDLFGENTDQVETHVSEPTEPVDVRKNRQLTLDNMKLHRELEKLKQSANEFDMVKKELRNTKSKYEEEQKVRHRLEQMLEVQNKKVKQIVEQMDGVEREFEKRDATIYDLEGQVQVEKSKVESYESELQKASKIIESQKNELLAARNMQKTLIEQCEQVEIESKELQEFLQIEKIALCETLKESESEVEQLQNSVKVKENQVQEVEERCGHLVRLSEQKNQEVLKLQNLLINQGSELYQFSAKLAKIIDKEDKFEWKDSESVRREMEEMCKNQLENKDSLKNLSAAIEKRRKSESILNMNQDHFDKLENLVQDLVNERNSNNDENNDQNDQNQLNTTNNVQHETMEEMRAKFMKHQQIYKTNYEAAESEIKRMDELYQDLIDNVHKTLTSIPETVNTQPPLQRLKELLESDLQVTSPVNNKNGKVAFINSTQEDQENLSL